MTEAADLAIPSVLETEPEVEHSVLLDPSLEVEPWRVFPDSDIEVPGDRLDIRGNQTEGPGIFRVHYGEKGIEVSDTGEETEKDLCFNDWTWGATYRHVQTILSILRGGELKIWHDSGHHHKGEEATLSIERLPILPEITVAMGAGDEWVPKEDEEEEENADDGEEEKKPKEKFFECAVVGPHDVHDYLQANYAALCGSLRLLMYQTREGASIVNSRTSLLGKESLYDVWDRPPGSYEIGNPAADFEAKRFRELIATHLFVTERPVLIDDSVSSYLVVGYREFDPEGPNEECPVQYRILDAQYGLRYAVRKHNFIFDPEKGPDQLGTDRAKDQWVPAEFLEEGRHVLNSYIPGPMWMMLLIGDEATSPKFIINQKVKAAQDVKDAAEAERRRALDSFMQEEERKAQEAIAAAAKAAAEEEETPEERAKMASMGL